MPVAFQNYYEILGLAPQANDAQIKKAYRDLARKYHPDVAKDKSDAGARFKEINEANEVLSDPEKRRKYDELGAHWNNPGQQTARPSPGAHGRAPNRPEFHFDGAGFSEFFEQYFGSHGHPAGGFGSAWETAAAREESPQRGQDVEGDILVTLDEVLQGSIRTVRQKRTDPRTGETATQTLRVKIPPGVREGQLIRLAGKGHESTGSGPAGHLYLRVIYARHPDFRVQGDNLYHDLELSPWEAVLGATIHAPTLHGTVALRIPPGTTAGREFRLRGLGLPNERAARGDLYVEVKIQVPSQLSPEQKILWEQLAATATFNPRNNV